MIKFCIKIFLRPVIEDVGPLKTNKQFELADEMLDLSGPKLLYGGRRFLSHYQIMGQLNILNKPLYLSIIYKISIIFLANFILIKRNLIGLNDLDLLVSVFRNPIFVFICCSAIAASITHSIIIIYINLFKLCPMFKILTTPKLCYLTKEVQLVFGDYNLILVFIFLIYNTCLVEMLVSSSYKQFMDNFNLIYFLVNLFSQGVVWYHVVGLSHLDFYVRCCFGCWIMALKVNFETRIERFRKYQKARLMKLMRRIKQKSQSNNELDGNPDDIGDEIDVSSEKFITLDEIQNYLNNMDDHLEVWRSVQTNSLALLSLNAFLNNGTLLLLAYDLMANQRDYYHGLIVLAIAVNYWIVLFFGYFGDQFVYYALRKFVQTVEDEYFLQGADDELEKMIANFVDEEYQQVAESLGELSAELQFELTELTNKLIAQHKTLLVKKKNVLFCHEFQHQFNTHLATPWSKLDFTSHLHMLGTFVTLIAAQIIFDKEH